MSSYTWRRYMAWIVQLQPSPRHPKPRWQVRHRVGSHERSPGICKTSKAAEATRRRVERGLPPALEIAPIDIDKAKAQTLFGDHVQNVWWPTWKTQHPDSATRPASGSKSASCRSSAAARSWSWTLIWSAPGKPIWPARGSSRPASTATSACWAPSSTPRSTATTYPTPL